MFSLERVQAWNLRIRIGKVSTWHIYILPLGVSSKERMYYLVNKNLFDSLTKLFCQEQSRCDQWCCPECSKPVPSLQCRGNFSFNKFSIICNSCVAWRLNGRSLPPPLHNGANRNEAPLRTVIRIQVGKRLAHSKGRVSANSLNDNGYYFVPFVLVFRNIITILVLFSISALSTTVLSSRLPFITDFPFNNSAFLAFSMYLIPVYCLVSLRSFRHHDHFLFHLGLLFSCLFVFLFRIHKGNDILHSLSIL